MKRFICVLISVFALSFLVAQQTNENIDIPVAMDKNTAAMENTFSSVTKYLDSIYWDFDLGVNNLWNISNPEYKTYLDSNYYFDPFFHVSGHFPLGKKVTFEPSLDWNLFSVVTGALFYNDWVIGCNTWAGDLSIMINIMTLGIPYIIGLAPAIALCYSGIDFNVLFFYHPYSDNNYDVKIGGGLAYAPSSSVFEKLDFNYYNQLTMATLVHPYVVVRGEVNYYSKIFTMGLYASCNIGFAELFNGMIYDYEGNLLNNKNNSYVNIGARIGLSTKR